MSERIDHAAEAMDLFNSEFGSMPNALGYDTADVQHLINMLGAQVHATLALVEQQRIANLIALHRHEVKYDVGSASRLYEGEPEEIVSDAVLKPDIREALGLT